MGRQRRAISTESVGLPQSKTLGLGNRVKLEFDLVPGSSWGNNLRNMLGRTEWDKLRAQMLAERGNKCAVCGSSERLQCHEVWAFDDKKRVQSLRGFQASCSLCHLASHFGLAETLAQQGHVNLENVIAHFLKVNRISKEQFETEKTKAFALWRKRSEREWKIDFGEWAKLLPNA